MPLPRPFATGSRFVPLWSPCWPRSFGRRARGFACAFSGLRSSRDDLRAEPAWRAAMPEGLVPRVEDLFQGAIARASLRYRRCRLQRFDSYHPSYPLSLTLASPEAVWYRGGFPPLPLSKCVCVCSLRSGHSTCHNETGRHAGAAF